MGESFTGPLGDFFFGTGVLAADGNSALIGGGPLAQIFTGSGSSWVSQLNAITQYRQFGDAVALSGDGSTALLTGSEDCGGGVAGSFIDTSAGWAAEPQLVASGAQVGPTATVSDQALSGDGSIAVLGGPGAVWTFAHRTAPFTVPTVTGVTPGALAPAGLGTQVAISGSGFSGTTSVTFGGIPAQYFCVVSPSEILATWSPSQPPPLGPADVVVSTPAGSSPTPSVPNFYVTTIPSTPTGVRATAGDHAATVTFTGSPATGSPITYTVRSDPSGRTVETGGTRATIAGLTPGQPSTFTVVASDPLGSSPPTTSSSTVTPYAAPTLGGVRISGLQSGAPRLRFTLHAGAGTAGVRLLTISLPSRPPLPDHPARDLDQRQATPAPDPRPPAHRPQGTGARAESRDRAVRPDRIREPHPPSTKTRTRPPTARAAIHDHRCRTRRHNDHAPRLSQLSLTGPTPERHALGCAAPRRRIPLPSSSRG